jgi:hypothetical protein
MSKPAPSTGKPDNEHVRDDPRADARFIDDEATGDAGALHRAARRAAGGPPADQPDPVDLRIGKAGARLPGSCCFADVDDYFDGFASGSFKVTAPLTIRGSTLISFSLAATSAGTSSW